MNYQQKAVIVEVCCSVTERLQCTWISGKWPCVYTRVTEVKCSCYPSVSLLRSLVWNYCVRVE